jgi:uncharacterized membrane protein
MTWRQRYRARALLRTSVWIVPLGAMVAALVAAPLLRHVDRRLGWSLLDFSPEGARAVLGAMAASMMTFIVFVFSILLVAVQIAGAQLSPRIIARAFRNPATRSCLALFTFTFTFTVAVLGRIEESTPQLSALVAVLLSLTSIGAFLYLIDYLGKGLRPVTILTELGAEGHDTIVAAYPRLIGPGEAAQATAPYRPASPLRRPLASAASGVVLAFDGAGLLAVASRADCVVELAPQVGDFVAMGDPLFLADGNLPTGEETRLQESVVLGPERTAEQDPAFAFRVIVDVAAKALSPAINDPTTAVLALDQLHHLLREVGRRHLDDGVVRDSGGTVRLLYRTPDWEAFVFLAVSEVRHYGASSVQVARRLRAMLENLIQSLPPQRVPLLEKELALLNEAVEREFPTVDDRSRAATPDYQGIGSALPRK